MPDSRGWLAIGIMALVFYTLTLIAFVPSLAQNDLFKTIAENIVTAGFIAGVVAFYYAANKGPPTPPSNGPSQ